MHPITQHMPSEQASRQSRHPIVSRTEPEAALLQLPAPGKRSHRAGFAWGLWRMLSIKLLLGGFGRFMTVLEGNNSGTGTPPQQDTN